MKKIIPPWLALSGILASLSFLTTTQAQTNALPGDHTLPNGQPGLFGSLYRTGQPGQPFFRYVRRPGFDSIRNWNEIAINTSGLDHTPVAVGENRVYGEQLGPSRASRAMAIVHIAMFDVANAILGGYHGYTTLPPVPKKSASLPAAVAQAAHDTLVALFPSQKPALDVELAKDLQAIRNGSPKTRGIDLGQRGAAAILALRANDGSEHVEPRIGVDFIPNDDPGQWRPDPISQVPVALGAYWGGVRPFVLPNTEQFRLPPPPAIDSVEYAIAFDEVKRLGGDGVITPTERTEDQTIAGIFWAYDGTPSLCAPSRLYNQIVMHIADLMYVSDIELARLLALVNIATADACIASWDSKFLYQYWRPITAIREADPGTGPTGLGDGNPLTTGDVTFTPLGAPASNLQGPNFTPPFPAYSSGHATLGGAVFQTLRHFFQTDAIPFTFVSDEFNGTTLDNQGNIRPLIPRSFNSLSEAEEENGQSRIYLGIHWSFDKTFGILQGRNVADYVFDNVLRPKRRR